MRKAIPVPCRFHPALVLLLAATVLFSCTVAPKQKRALLTRAEASGFKETSRYDDVMAFLRTLEEESFILHLTSMGTTAEGRSIPLVILADPPVWDPSEVDREKTTVVYIQANIHAGEVEGKEACQMLIRDIVRGGLEGLVRNMVVLVAPIYNADGNEHVSLSNRSGQDTPEGPVGIRTNARSLDLNRDMMKLESLEAQSLVKNVLNRWDPQLIVDCHTTNGSYHQEPITYAPPHCPLDDPELGRFNEEVMLPWIVEETRRRENYLAIPYGNFRDPSNPALGWYTFDHKPRYVTNYIGLRNRLSILIEMYKHADFEVRTRACRAFLQSILAFSQNHGDAMRAATAKADAAAVAAGLPDAEPLRFHTQFEEEALEEMITVKGYKMEIREDDNGRKRARRIFEEPVDYLVPYVGRFTASGDGIPLPDAYVFPRGLYEIRDKLCEHGIRVDEVPGPFTTRVDAFLIEKIDAKDRLYQGHRITRLEGRWEEQEVTFQGGAFLVPSNQPLAMLAAYLLEPESDDGLAAWNFMDRYLARGNWDARPGTFPIMRIERGENANFP